MTILEAEKVAMPFGVNTGRSLAEIAAADVLYLHWLAGLENLVFYTKEAVALVAQKHERAIEQALAAKGRRPRAPSRDVQGQLF